MKNSKDKDQIAALIKVALKSGNISLASDCIKMWQVEWTNSGHCDLLHVAAECGEVNFCRILVEQNKFPVNLFDTTGEETAIHYAACKGHVQVIKYLYEQCSGDLNATYSKVNKTKIRSV